MRVLVACEFSGRVREAFAALGHDAWSCDLLPTELPGKHIIGDVRGYLQGWDIIIAHPPCTHLAVSGARWFKDKKKEQEEAIAFFMTLIDAPAPRVAVENPISIMSKVYYAPDQIVQPHWFGDAESKAICLWLKGLPLLRPTARVPLNTVKESVHREPPGPYRWKNRSRTFLGIARAMAEQWGERIRRI